MALFRSAGSLWTVPPEMFMLVSVANHAHAPAMRYALRMAKKTKFTIGRFRLRVRRAATGRGLFAEEAIPRGSCIIEYTGRPATLEEMARDEGKYLFWTGKTTMINGNIHSNTARYINHSCAPNCEADGPAGRIFILARRRILPGEELTYDYGKEYFNKHLKPSGCRCIKCMGMRANPRYTPLMSVGRISPIERKKSHSRKTKKRLQIKAAMLAARRAKKGTKKRAKRQ